MNSHLRMSSSLKNGGCVVESFQGFSSKQSPYNFVGNEGIYSMGEEYKSHT